MRWAIPAGTTVFAVPRVVPEVQWECPNCAALALNVDAWRGFGKWIDTDVDAVTSYNRWDELARYTVVEFRFDADDTSQAIQWPIKTQWIFVTLTDKNPDFVGFLVNSEDCVELPF